MGMGRACAWAAMFMIGRVAGADEPGSTEYRVLTERHVWAADIIAESSSWEGDSGKSRSSSRSAVVLATEPRVGQPGLVGVLLASAQAEGESTRKGKWKSTVEPPNEKTSYEGGINEAKSVPVDTKRGPKMALVGFLSVDPHGKWLAARSGGKAGGRSEPQLLGVLWPELPGKPLVVGSHWKEQKEMAVAWTRDLMVELDVQVTATDKGIAVLKIHVDRTLARDELDLNSRIVASLSEAGKAHFVADATARVRADAPEWLGGSMTMTSELMDGDKMIAGASGKVAVELTSKPDVYCDCGDVLFAQLR